MVCCVVSGWGDGKRRCSRSGILTSEELGLRLVQDVSTWGENVVSLVSENAPIKVEILTEIGLIALSLMYILSHVRVSPPLPKQTKGRPFICSHSPELPTI